mmetsp:Transcript_18392/g.41622  ORF Transcript_18392/g.41622 Transcript_18392/m.41622 type:complete len:222 (-) Transcript_18392:444-1109(-)
MRQHLPREEERLQGLEELHGRLLPGGGLLHQEAVSTRAEHVQAVDRCRHVPQQGVAVAEVVLIVVRPEGHQGDLALLLVHQRFWLLAAHSSAEHLHALLVLTAGHEESGTAHEIQLLLPHQLQDLLLLPLLLARGVRRPLRVQVQEHLIAEGEGDERPQLLGISRKDSFWSAPAADTQKVLMLVDAVVHPGQHLLDLCLGGVARVQELHHAHREVDGVAGQ